MAEEDIRVTIGIQGEKIKTLTELCTKMDMVIEKLNAQHDRHMEKIYEDMDMRRRETDADIKEIHDRIDTVLDRVQSTEKSLLDEIKLLRKEIQAQNSREKETISKLMEWRWVLSGALFVVIWLLSHVKFDTMVALFK